MVVTNLILTLIVSLASIYLLQERFISAKAHKKDRRYSFLRGFIVLLTLACLATNLEPMSIGATMLLLHSSILLLQGYLIKTF